MTVIFKQDISEAINRNISLWNIKSWDRYKKKRKYIIKKKAYWYQIPIKDQSRKFNVSVFVRYKERKTRSKRFKKYRDRFHIKIFNDYWWDIKNCQTCWWNIGLQIHHIDKNRKNNDITNLTKVYLQCHCNQHKWDSIYPLMMSRLRFITKQTT